MIVVSIDTERLLERARTAKRASKYVVLRAAFDPENGGDWRELMRDLSALANSGGGVVVVDDARPVLELGAARIADALVAQVGESFRAIETHELQRDDDGVAAAAIVVGAASAAPLVIEGTPYFRHGGKSRPATSADLRTFIERRLALQRRELLAGVKKVITAPSGAEIVAIQRTDTAGEPSRIQITTDDDAPVYGRIDPDATHPFRQKELLKQINARLPEAARINAYDMVAVRKTLGIDHETHPQFVHLFHYGGVQYSEAFVDWIVHEYGRDTGFFDQARRRYYELRRQK
jgi:hypothetical protein